MARKIIDFDFGLTIGVFLIIAGVALFYIKHIKLAEWICILIVVGGLFCMVCACTIMLSGKLLNFIEKMINSLKIIKNKLTITAINYTSGSVILIFLLSIISSFLYFLSCYLLACSIFLKSTFVSISGGVAIAGMFNMLPVTIMGMGTREVTFLYVFSDLNEAKVKELFLDGDALSISLIILLPVIIAILSFVVKIRRKQPFFSYLGFKFVTKAVIIKELLSNVVYDKVRQRS